MDIVQSVTRRRSIRAFKPEPVPRSVITELMTLALRAPSWCNSQPWEFAVATGKPLAEIRRRYIEKENDTPAPDFQQTSYFPEIYDARARVAIARSHASRGIQRENREQRHKWEIEQLSNFGAPCEIYVCLDRSFRHKNGDINVWPIFDCGSAVGFVTLLATNYNLGTIIQARSVIFPNVVREVLGIPESKLLLVGIGIGYPDWEDPVNQFVNDREPAEKLVRWQGFDL
jgi:nitroreductase